MHQDKYSLTWKSYSDHLRSMMKQLMMNEDFSDVTLVTEDKKHIKANINILSTCSPVFKDMLKKEKNTNQIMYLRGVQYSEMESIMQFIYLGEATFYEERMDDFLAVAKSLEIKQLCNAETETNDEPDDDPSSCDPVTSTEFLEGQSVISDQIKMKAPEDRQWKVDSVSGIHECDECHKTYSSNKALCTHKKIVHQGAKYICDQCDYQATQTSDLTKHIQSKHEGIKYACDLCEYQATRKDDLSRHIQSKHKGVKYACDQCGQECTYKSSLAVHIQTQHEGIRYDCDKCDYQATQQRHLTKHITIKHEGVKLDCDQCDFQFTQQSNLTRHIQLQHKGIRYACDKCDFKATLQSSLTKHIQSKHEGVKYACDQCGQQFTAQSSLTLHIQIYLQTCQD